MDPTNNRKLIKNGLSYLKHNKYVQHFNACLTRNFKQNVEVIYNHQRLNSKQWKEWNNKVKTFNQKNDLCMLLKTIYVCYC